MANSVRRCCKKWDCSCSLVYLHTNSGYSERPASLVTRHVHYIHGWNHCREGGNIKQSLHMLHRQLQNSALLATLIHISPTKAARCYNSYFICSLCHLIHIALRVNSRPDRHQVLDARQYLLMQVRLIPKPNSYGQTLYLNLVPD